MTSNTKAETKTPAATAKAAVPKTDVRKTPNKPGMTGKIKRFGKNTTVETR